MLVCRLWRDVALATAVLWTVIDIPRELDRPEGLSYKTPKVTAKMRKNALKWFNLILSRSARMPLELVFTRSEYGTAALPILAAESHRIRSLTFPDSNTPRPTSAVISVLQLDLPAIVELNMLYDQNSKLKYQPTQLGSPPERRAEITPERYPSLRDMRLSNLTILNASTSVFPQLERLDLRFCSFDGLPASLDNLFDVLEGCPNLVELQLHFVLGMLVDQTPPEATRMITFSELQKLVLKDVPALTRRFLSHVSIPATTTLRVTGTLGRPRVVRVYDTLISMIPPPNSRNLPVFSSLTEGTVQNWGESPYLQMSSPTTKLSLKLLHDTGECSDLPACLAVLSGLCAGSPLTTLDIRGDFDEVDGTPPISKVSRGLPGAYTLSPGKPGAYLGLGLMGLACGLPAA